MAFIKTNLNPLNKKTSDSHIRAVAAACSITWDEAFKQLSDQAFRQKDTSWDIKVIESVLVKNGFSIGKISVPKGSKRPTVRDFADEHPDYVCVLRISGYYIACAYGNYVDLYDYGDSRLYKYWYKKIH